MLKLGMLEMTSAPACVNGFFGMPKGDTDIRLILDARAANCLFVDPPHVQLPIPSDLAQLLIPADSPLLVAKLDISNFYHRISLPSWIRPFFSLPSLSHQELLELSSSVSPSPASSAAIASGLSMFPCCTTLPMGFSHSVFIAQTIHEHILYSSSLLSSVDNILNRLPPQIDSSPHALYIDDCIVLDCCLSPAQKYYHALFFTTEDGILMSSSNDTVSSGDVADPSLSDAPGHSQFSLSQAFGAFDSLSSPSMVTSPLSYDRTTGVVRLIADKVTLPDTLHHVSMLSCLHRI